MFITSKIGWIGNISWPCPRVFTSALRALLIFIFCFWLLPTVVASGEPLPIANFKASQSSVSEKKQRIRLEVAFTHSFAGRLTYGVDGTSKWGKDFDLSGSTVETNGLVRELDIVINLLDDALVEDIETIRITLLPNEGLEVGSVQQHTVSIHDNDTQWSVLHDVDGMQFGYWMRIIRNGKQTAATIISNGDKGLPAGTYPVNLTKSDDSGFEAKVGPVKVASDLTLLGVDIDRTFVLTASPSDENYHKIDYDRMLTGIATEQWSAAKGASHLDNHISGSFVMLRTTTPIASRTDTSDANTLTSPIIEPICDITDIAFASSFVSKLANQPNQQSQGSIAPNHPYHGFVGDTLKRTRALLYWDRTATPEKNAVAAFRYKTLLYEPEEVEGDSYIRANFENITDYWKCEDKKRAYQAAQLVINAIRYAPLNQQLRRILLDIYYEIAVADKALAQEGHIAVAGQRIEPSNGESAINAEISVLERTLPLYRRAFADYMKLLRSTFGIAAADYFGADTPPFGYYLFREEVPLRSPYATVFKRANGEWVIPHEGFLSDERPQMFEGYKDATLLFEVLRDYLRTAEELSRLYVIRGDYYDRKSAEELLNFALQSTYLEGHALLAMFPDIREKSENTAISGLKDAVAGWRLSYSALSNTRRILNGDTNILGYPDEIIVLPQSVIQGDDQSFHSFSFFKTRLEDDSGPLKQAISHLNAARNRTADYGTRSDRLALEYAEITERYNARLAEIVGVWPGESGYDNPSTNAGEIAQQLGNIEISQNIIDRTKDAINKLEANIRILVKSRSEASGIYSDMSEIYINYGERQVSLSEEINEIGLEQARFERNIKAVGGFIGGITSLLSGNVGEGIQALFGAATNAYIESVKIDVENKKNALVVSKERLAAQERAEITARQGALNDLEFLAKIKSSLLEMRALELDAANAAISYQQGLLRLSALYYEKENLEQRKIESIRLRADRYFADPSHRLLKDAALLRSESSFLRAQRWLFLAMRAAEYKWNTKFENRQALFKARNANELDVFFDLLKEWDAKIYFGARNDGGEKILSIRDHFLGIRSIPRFGESSHRFILENQERFNQYLKDESNYLGASKPDNPIQGFKVLKFRFSTAFVPSSGGLFMPNRWNEKIFSLRVWQEGGALGNTGNFIDGYLTYGGVGLIRNRAQGATSPNDPSRLVNETTAYSMQSWNYENGRWESDGAFGSPISILVTDSPDIQLGNKEINAFKEFSVAATEWELFVAVENSEGVPLLDVDCLDDQGCLDDIKFKINYYYYTR